MPEKRLTNIQWQYVRHSLWTSVAAVTVGALSLFILWRANCDVREALWDKG